MAERKPDERRVQEVAQRAIERLQQDHVVLLAERQELQKKVKKYKDSRNVDPKRMRRPMGR